MASLAKTGGDGEGGPIGVAQSKFELQPPPALIVPVPRGSLLATSLLFLVKDQHFFFFEGHRRQVEVRIIIV